MDSGEITIEGVGGIGREDRERELEIESQAICRYGHYKQLFLVWQIKCLHRYVLGSVHVVELLAKVDHTVSEWWSGAGEKLLRKAFAKPGQIAD